MAKKKIKIIQSGLLGIQAPSSPNSNSSVTKNLPLNRGLVTVQIFRLHVPFSFYETGINGTVSP